MTDKRVSIESGRGRAAQLLATSAFASLAILWASPAFAQQTDDKPAQPAQSASQPSTGSQSEDQQEIVITASQVNLTREYPGGQVARGSRAGLLGNLDNMESPFAATAFTENLIREQQAQSVGDVLKNEPGIEVDRGFGNFQQVYMVRGFPTYSDDMTYNGVFGILPREFVASEFIERVEIFRGANSFLNGAAPGGSAVGGMVNLVPKRAPSAPLFRVTFGADSLGQLYGAFDYGHRFGSNGAFGIRINGAARAGETEVHDQNRYLKVASIGTDYRGNRVRLTVDAGYQDQLVDAPRPSVTPATSAPPPPKASSNYAERWTYAREKELFGAARGEFDIARDVTMWAAIGGRHGTEANDLANPTAQVTGETSAYRFDNFRKDNVVSADAGIRAEMHIGDIENRIIVSGSIFNISSRNAYNFYFTPSIDNLYNPVTTPAPTGGFILSGGVLDSPHVTFTTNEKSVAAADIFQAFDKALTLIAGVRYQRIDNASFDYNSGAETSRIVGDAYTPAVGAVVRPIKQLAFYANYAESLVPGAVAPSTSGGLPVTNAGQVFQPFRAKQEEAGAKLDLGTLGGSLSFFSIDLPSAYVANQVYSVSGKQRNRGIELDLYGEPVHGFRLIGGFTYLNARTLQTAIPADNGRYAIGVPKWQESLNAEWDVPGTGGLTVEGRVTHKSSQYITATNNFSIPQWTLFDLGVRYKLPLSPTQSVTLRARVDNIANKGYWAAAGGYPGANYLVLGEPRTVSLSAAFDL